MTRLALRLLLTGIAVVPLVWGAAAVADGPTVELAGSGVVETGDQVEVRIAGFDSSFVTISTCGNEARRGSVDCNLVSSKGLRLNSEGESIDLVTVAEPPMKCPCVIRVANESNDEVATVAIDLNDHPTGPVVDPTPVGEAVGLSVSALPATEGFADWARGAMGGSARYAVTVQVVNRTTATLRNVALFGSVGRGESDELVTMDLPNPGPISPGGTWTQTIHTRVPTPSVGTFRFRVTATGAGSTVDASASHRHSTPLLLALLTVVVLDVLVLVIRRLDRRRRQRVATPSTTTA